MAIKDFYNNLSENKQKALDQVFHFLWAFLALIPVMTMDSLVVGGALSGLFLALPRELVDQWPIKHIKDTLLDLAFFALGGAAIGYYLLTL